MDKVKPVMPYVVSSYLDKEEETWLKGNESQRAWAAVNAQEVEALDIKSEPVATVIPLPHPTSAQPDNEGNSKTPTPPTSTPSPIDIATPSEYRTPLPAELAPEIVPTPTNPNDKSILEWVVDGLEEYTLETYHYKTEPNLSTGGGGMPGGLNDTNVAD